MAVARRNPFGTSYGTTKLEQGKGRAPKVGAMTTPPVPLSMQAQAVMPNEQPAMGAQSPQSPQAQGAAPGPGAPLDPKMEAMLQQLLARYGQQGGSGG